MTAINPPIVVRTSLESERQLATVQDVITYLRHHGHDAKLAPLREAAFVAAALPTPENIDALRKLADEKLR